MKRMIFVITCLIYTFSIYSQSREVSLLFSSYKISGTYFSDVDQYYYDVIDFKHSNTMWYATLGYNFKIYNPTNNLAFGINTTGQVGTLLRSFGDGDEKIMFDFGLPVTGTLRYGAGSNKNATLPVGLGIGFGYRLNAMVVDGDIFLTNKDVILYKFFRPYGFLELVFDFQKRNRSFFDNFKIQFAFQPVLKNKYYDSELDDYYGNKMTYYSISFIKF